MTPKPIKHLLFAIIILLVVALVPNAHAQTQTVVNGAATTINFPGTNCYYTWVNDNPAIGLPANGTGNIPSFTAVNNGPSPIKANITATPLVGGSVYTTSISGSSTSAIDPGTNAIVTNISTGLDPDGIVLSPDGSRLYVINAMSFNISVISTTNNKVISTIQLPFLTGIGGSLAISADGKFLYACNFNYSTTLVINTQTSSVVATVNVGMYPAGAAMSLDGTKVYVVNSIDGTVSVINTATNLVAKTLNVAPSGSMTSALTISPDGSRLYLVYSGYTNYYVLNTATNAVTTIPLGFNPSGVTTSPDGARVYVCGGANKVSAFDAITNSLVTNFFVGGSPINMAVSKDGSQLYVVNSSSGTLSIVNTATNTVSSSVNIGAEPYGVVALTPGLGCAPVTFTITVNPTLPTINTTGALSTLNTTYGTPSTSTTFSVSGTDIAGDILVTPPTGFEVSFDNINFSSTVTLGGTGTVASTVVYTRLAAITNAGTYAGNVTLKSAGAPDVLMPIGSSVVSPAPLNIMASGTKTYGVTLTDFDFANNPSAFSGQIGLKDGNIINGAHVTYFAATDPTAPVGTYQNAISASAITGANGFLASNYTVNFTAGPLIVEPAPLTIKATDVTKTVGAQLTGGAGSIAYTVTGLQNGETTGAVTITYGTGAAAIAAPGTYTGSVVASSVTGGTFAPSNYTVTYNPGNIIVEPPSPPVVTVTGTLSSLTTTYGTPSPSTSFTVSGVNITGGILTTPPPGFEVSLDNITFNSTVSVSGSGTITSTPVYIRIAAITPVGTYSGPINLTSSGGATASIAMANSTVTPAPLIIIANDVSKVFGNAITGSAGSTAFTVSGLKNSETIVSVTITYGAGSAALAPAGSYTGAVKPSLAFGGTFNINNYTITYVAGAITVNPVTIAYTGTLQPLNTIYGTPSSSTSFTVSGTNITGGILITPPAGFEVSLDNNSFSSTVTVGSNGTVGINTIYIRLAATTPVGGYAGNIILSSLNATEIPIAMPNSTVNTTPLTITADNKDKFFGTANPPLTFTYQGFVNNENATALITQPVISTVVNTLTAVGQYPINISGATSSNYSITYINGVFTVRYGSLDKYIPNTFTPNGDGVNDTWVISALNQYPNCTVHIFNRYGVSLFASIGYSKPWDGTYNGAPLPVGTYYYIIDPKGDIKVASGSVTIIR